MERSSITRWVLIAGLIFVVWTYGDRFFGSSKKSTLQPLGGVNDELVQNVAAPEKLCSLAGPGFVAQFGSHGASLRKFALTDSRYTDIETKAPIDLVTTTRVPREPLRTDLRIPDLPAGQQQVDYTDVDWTLAEGDASSCSFSFADDTSRLTKRVRATGKPYELAITVAIENLAKEPRKHRFEIEQDSWREKKKSEGHFGGGQSEWQSEVVAVSTAKVERHGPSDFEPGDFSKPEFTKEKWRRTPGEAKAAAISVMYFAQIVMPTKGSGVPAVETQIEERWDTIRYPNKADDPQFGHVYRARIAYPEKQLAPGEIATYEALAYAGPKDRDLLASIDHGAPEVLNLGTFSFIARGLIWYLYRLYGLTRSWGWAIVLLTVTVRIGLSPLMVPQIKTSMAMRKLKPEMDALNEKYKDDAAQRGLAIQELWRKNNVSNPMLGCLPMLFQMPIWWALYTALQTAVELYHVPFGPFIPDLTSPGKYFIIPIVLGASSFFQQKLMPPQGDPQQQKMMLYMMPAIFTFMMLFLPAGLGVYMLTNSVLAIGQQVIVERYLKRGAASAGQILVKEKISGDGDRPSPALGKGKARARG